MSETAEPLPCPFCGGEGKAVTDSSGHWHWVICSSEPKDAMLIGCDDTAAKAIARWNTRATNTRLSQAEKALAELRAIAEKLLVSNPIQLAFNREAFTEWKERNPV